MRQQSARNRVTLKHVKRVTKPNGRVFLYLALPGRELVRLPDSPMDSPEFLEAYGKARKGAPQALKGRPTAEGSIGAAVIAYQRSTAFLGLSEATRANRRRILSKIADIWGAARLADLREKHIEADIAKSRAHAAVSRLKVWRGFCAWAKGAKLIAADVSAGVDRPATPKSNGHTPWTAGEVETFRQHWPIDTAQRLAMELIYWTAARASDAARLGPGMIDREGWLVFKQQKTGGEVSIPFNRALPTFARDMAADLAHLKAAIDAGPRHMTWTVTAFGTQRSVKAFCQWFSRAASEAGLSDRTAHGLRKARATALAEAGATTHQIAAWTGHETLSEVQRYAKTAEKRRLLSGTDGEQKLETASGEFPKKAKIS